MRLTNTQLEARLAILMEQIAEADGVDLPYLCSEYQKARDELARRQEHCLAKRRAELSRN